MYMVGRGSEVNTVSVYKVLASADYGNAQGAALCNGLTPVGYWLQELHDTNPAKCVHYT